MAILTLRPNGDNAAGCAQTRSTGSYNYACVDEATYDNADYCYVSSAASPRRDHYDLPDHGTENGPISKITVKAKSKYVASGGGSDSGSITLSLRVSGTDYDDSGHSLSTSEAEYSHDWTTNPATGNAWSWSEIDALIAGDVLAAAGSRVDNTDPKNPVTYYSNSYDFQFWVEVTYTATISPSSISSGAAFGFPSLNFKLSPSGISSLASFGSPLVAFAGNYIYPPGVASLEGVGVPVVINRQIITPQGIELSALFGTPQLRFPQVITPTGIVLINVFGIPGLYQGRLTPVGIPSGIEFGVAAVIRYGVHIILEAYYDFESQEVNRSYVVGQDAAGSSVNGSAITQGEVDLVGERLEVQHEPAATTAGVAASVAAAVLARNRLNAKSGQVTLPPHCGLELWDVLDIDDTGCNQSATYRVTGYTFEFDVKQALYQHQIALSAP